MLTGKQRAYLRGLANGLDTAVYIGKNELTDTIIMSMDEYLDAHEMVKVKIQEGVELDPKQVANDAAVRLNAEFVQAIGRRFTLYRPSKEKQIVLPR
ncbi:MAG: YhbY family RNA-binding protein [Clostridia bacterium]|nr:YhbY family RNA-binding protein [Clostridia bacterium]